MTAWERYRGAALRVFLSAVLVVVCYHLPWGFLRLLTSECVLQVSRWFGLPMQRVSADVIECSGTRFTFTISCTFVDVFFGAIPLLWQTGATIMRNVRNLLLLAASLFAFNIVRLEIGHLLFERGWPWVLVHEAASGACYFIIWLVISRWTLKNLGLERLDSLPA